jgi:UDP-N-acetylmuramate dehydrogenase
MSGKLARNFLPKKERYNMPLWPGAPWDLPTLLRDVPGRKAFQCPLAPYTSLRIGGPADALVQVEAIPALQQVQMLARQHNVPLTVLGGGSNLLIRDGGVRGIVVALRGDFRDQRLELGAPDVKPVYAHVHVGAGASFSRLALRLARQGWSGLEFAYGIPGTLGGAMVMNAGTYLGDLSQVLVSARLLCAQGHIQTLPVQALGLRYRTSAYPPGAVLLEATLRVQAGDVPTMEAAAYPTTHLTECWLDFQKSLWCSGGSSD